MKSLYKRGKTVAGATRLISCGGTYIGLGVGHGGYSPPLPCLTVVGRERGWPGLRLSRNIVVRAREAFKIDQKPTPYIFKAISSDRLEIKYIVIKSATRDRDRGTRNTRTEQLAQPHGMRAATRDREQRCSLTTI